MFAQFKQHHFNRAPATWGCTPVSARSDIVLHLPVLEWFARQCHHGTEFGVRDGSSTAALLAGLKVLHSYDIEETWVVKHLRSMSLPAQWFFHREDTGSPTLEIEETDLLFFDTLHTDEHIRKELRHLEKVKKYAIFHDTFTCGERDLSGPNPQAEGIIRAIRELDWKVVYETEANNGLIVMERK